ncbi:DUF5641 domain-containing protein [Trichonephila clavipes]|nr:DUF5641 domain-containing protein [Trichonephila clavipes]
MDSWPKQPKRNDQTSSVSKERKRTAFSFLVAVNCDFIDYLFLKFSSFTKIIDIFAFCFRYITNCKARVGKMKNLDSKGKYHVPPLTTYERRQASEVITSSPEHTNDDKLSLRSRWDIVQKMKLGFWRKWKMDYLSNLQNRTKWKSPNHNFKVGEIVIIKEDNIPPATWPLGKVIETHPGKDGVVRVVTLRTVKGRFKRPIHKLCKLPLHQE